MIGYEGRHDYSAIGTVANLASRLANEANGGQILVTRRVSALVEQIVKAEPMGDLQVKDSSNRCPRSTSSPSNSSCRTGESLENGCSGTRAFIQRILAGQRSPGNEHLHAQAAEDELRQDHAPPPARHRGSRAKGVSRRP